MFAIICVWLYVNDNVCLHKYGIMFISYFVFEKLELIIYKYALFCLVSQQTSPMDLIIYFRGEKHHVGLIHLEDFIVDRIRDSTLGLYKHMTETAR